MRRSVVLIAILAASTLVPAAALALVSLTSAGGFLYDCYETSGGYLSNGSIDAYDGMYRLRVNSTVYSTTAAATTTMGGRQVEMAEMAIGGLMVKRIFYVPTSGGEYGRYLEVVRNPGTTPVMATIEIYGNLGSDSSTVLTATSSGDTILTTMDNWFATDDSSTTSGDPSLAHVIQGDGGLVRATTVTRTTDNLTWSFSTSVPAGGQVAVLTFALQNMNQPAVQAEAARVVDLPADTLAGIDTYLPDIINFPVGGAPVVRFMGPAEEDEGTDITLDIEVVDLEMDPTTWSWDLDDDGTFGETPMAMSHTIMGDTTDGPDAIRVGVQASDGSETRDRYWTVTINNVAPEVTSTPPTDPAYIGAEWRYELMWTDPAAARDLPIFTLMGAPSGMMVSRGGIITWTPASADRDMVFTITVGVDDADGGVTSQMFDITVSNNRPPTDPMPLSPIMREHITNAMPTLVIRNGTDPDMDRMSYYFRIDNVSSFDSAFMIESPEVVEMMGGMTSWGVPTNLTPGIWFWQVKGTDGIAETDWINAVFVLDEPGSDAGPLPDAGPRPDSGTIAPPPTTGRRGDSGCACRAAGRDREPPTAGFAFALLVALALGRRRRRR